MASQKQLAGAALAGAASGMRTFTPPAALALRGRLGQGPARAAVLAAAAGEYVGDKSPLVPARIGLPSLLARVSSGTFAGRTLAGTPGAGLGAAGALAGTFASYRARLALTELTGLPDPVIGVVEDGLAMATAALATRAASPEPPPEEPGEDPAWRRIARGAVRGAVAGVAGTAAMTGAQLLVLRATGGEESRVPEQVGRKLLDRLFGVEVPRKQRGRLNQAVHWAYGTSWGVDLGVGAAARGARPGVLAGGLGLGLTAWVAALVQLPSLGVAPPPWEQSPGALATDAGLHLLHGVTTAAVLKVLP